MGENENGSNGKTLNVYTNNIKNDYIQHFLWEMEIHLPEDCKIWVAGFASLILNGYLPILRSKWHSFVLF